MHFLVNYHFTGLFFAVSFKCIEVYSRGNDLIMYVGSIPVNTVCTLVLIFGNKSFDASAERVINF